MNDNSLQEIKKLEEKKYKDAWAIGAEGQSQTAIPILNYVKNIILPKWKVLEMGCGKGMAVNSLHNIGINVYGVDIVIEQIKEKNSYFFKAPLWDLPFKDNEFDFTFSTDVLEHLPSNLVDKSIKEIFKVTKIKTFHCIALFEDNRGGFHFHETVKSIEWWKEQFDNLNSKKISIEIIDRKTFLANYGK